MGLQKASDKQRATEDANDMQTSTFKSHLPTPNSQALLYLSLAPSLPHGGLRVVAGGMVQLDTEYPRGDRDIVKYCKVFWEAELSNGPQGHLHLQPQEPRTAEDMYKIMSRIVLALRSPSGFRLEIRGRWGQQR